MKELRITMYLRTNYLRLPYTDLSDIANLIEDAILTQGYLVDINDNEFIQVEKVEESD